jgi:hypothetical protein
VKKRVLAHMDKEIKRKTRNEVQKEPTTKIMFDDLYSTDD